MQTFIALLRGINVSGQKKVPMAELRDLLSKSGLNNVQTYIQSGNVVFQSSEENKKTLEENIQKTIVTQFGFEVPVLVKTPKEIQNIIGECPFSEVEKESSYFTLLHNKPGQTLVDAVSKESYPNETFHITDVCVYLYASTGYGNAKYNTNFFERKLKVSATTRNYKTMIKLLSLSAE
jgi:uncharacterized protein (DUF1697 family)